MKGNGGNGRKKTGITMSPEPETIEERQKASLENKRGQFILLKLISILGIKAIKEEDLSPRWLMINLDGLSYDFTEICEKALKDIELFKGTKTQL